MGRLKQTFKSVFAEEHPGAHKEQSKKAGKAVAKKLFVILGILVVAAALILLIHGNYVTLYFNTEEGVTAEDVSVVFETEDIGKVKDISVKNRIAAVALEKVSTGVTPIGVKVGSTTHELTLNTKGPLVYIEQNTVFPCWQLLIYFGFLFCLAATVVFALQYRKTNSGEFFSTAAIYFLGFAVFFTFMSIGFGLLTVMLLIEPSAYALGNVFNWVRTVMIYFTLITMPAVFLFTVALFISNVSLIRHEGFKFVNLLGIILSFLMVIGMVFGFVMLQVLEFRVPYVVVEYFLNAYYGIYAFFLCLLLGVFLVFARVVRHRPDYDKDFIIILGCRVKPDGTLYPLVRGRVDRAIAFAKAQEEATGKAPFFIPSGGKGDNETISEGQAMADYLIEQGIPAERVFPETESRNTKENIRFSMKIAEENRLGEKAIFATTNYHVFRSGVIANDVSANLDGIGSRTKWYFWPNALIREFIGLLVDDLPGILKFIAAILIVCAAIFVFLNGDLIHP